MPSARLAERARSSPGALWLTFSKLTLAKKKTDLPPRRRWFWLDTKRDCADVRESGYGLAVLGSSGVFTS